MRGIDCEHVEHVINCRNNDSCAIRRGACLMEEVEAAVDDAQRMEEVEAAPDDAAAPR